ncbi:tetratricopeptide repeat protein [Thiobacillus sedimenti]|uniref:protein O-GlcNAc transferase n=1 Tax=Thiobacillus sedimenti TaxID=3110231 RepID=A0ABZ1CHS5_9PROT|nr:tetratricopeptide repeat protein [Thiobacillus sp. SCUT-2]WRS38941.1 tetratricopeptide repeat protein [Thiobacillus sp. SCUT-2]
MSAHSSSDHAAPQAIDLLLQQAIAHHRSGRLLEAGQLYQAILQREPVHPEANHNLAMIAVEAGQPVAGLPYFAAALDADPTRAAYWLHYIDALFQAGQAEDARAVLELARQQGLGGDETDALATRIGLAPTAQAEPDGPHDEGGWARAASHSGEGVPGRQDMDALVTLFAAGRYGEVVAGAQRLAERFPQHVFGWKILGVALKLLGRGQEALEPMRRAARLSPADVESHYNLGVTLQELGRLDEAEASYRQALQIDPLYADAHLNLGVALQRLGRLDEAEASLRQALQVRPDYAEAHGNLGSILREQGRLDEAEASLRQALRARPDDAVYQGNLGKCLQQMGHLEEAAASYRQALQINPDDADIHNDLAVLNQRQGRLEEADAHFQIALHIRPDDARTLANRGNLLRHMGRLPEAEANFRRALERNPEDVDTHVKLGNVLRKLGHASAAETSFRRALDILPDHADAHTGLALALQTLGRLGEAEACYRAISQRWPDNAGVLSNLAQVLLDQGRLNEADECFRQALQTSPDHGALYSNFLYYLTLSASADPQAVSAEHRGFGERFETGLRPHWPAHANTRDPERGLRVGFVSPDFHNHAVASFIEPVLIHLSGYPHLTLHAFYNSFIHDDVTRRLRGHFAHWHPVADLSDAELADAIQADGIDILIDLTGHTASNRLLAFARKPAPVQASWLGYPGTTGLRAVDYYLADRFLLPPGRFDDQFTEKIVRLPANAPFLPHAAAPAVSDLPALQNGHLTFGSFNRPNKLSRAVIAVWSRLLRALPDSRLLLGGMPERGHSDTLLGWFAEEGIVPERLDFHPRSGMEDYLKLYQGVDICLDTFPYNGGTTTHHSLWMGVPTLVIEGDSMPGRVGTAILSRVGLQDFVVEDADAFVARGVHWANHLPRLAELRAGMREHLAQSPLRRPELLAAGLDLALREMWRRWCAGLPADTFEVSLDKLDATMGETKP